MDATIAAVLVIIARTSTPMVSIREARVDDLNSESTAAAHAIIVGIEAAGAEFVALAARAAAVGLSLVVEFTLEEPLADGAVVDACGAGPLPGLLAAVTSRTHPAVLLEVDISFVSFIERN